MINSYPVYVTETRKVQVGWIHAPTKDNAEKQFSGAQFKFVLKARKDGLEGPVSLGEPNYNDTTGTSGWLS